MDAALRDALYAEAEVFLALAALAAVFRCSTVCTPNFLVKRSTRPSVSRSFCRPVAGGADFQMKFRLRRTGRERIPARATRHHVMVSGVDPFLHSQLLGA